MFINQKKKMFINHKKNVYHSEIFFINQKKDVYQSESQFRSRGRSCFGQSILQSSINSDIKRQVGRMMQIEIISVEGGIKKHPACSNEKILLNVVWVKMRVHQMLLTMSHLQWIFFSSHSVWSQPLASKTSFGSFNNQ